MARSLIAISLATALAFASGCSISASSESISDSVSSPFKWSSASSDSDDDEKEAPKEAEPKEDRNAYGQDVRQVAASFARGGGEVGALRGQIGKLASQRGVTNWETDTFTCRNIGEGAALGGMMEQQFGAFSQQVCGDSSAMRAAISDGYRTSSQ